MLAWFSFAVSIIALAVAAITAWLTFFRRGELRMTQPTIVYVGPDGPERTGKNKVYLRTLLYSTAKRGQVVESLYVSLQRNESKQNFSVWVYGDRSGDLKRGSGIFVPQEGVTLDHHFLLPEDGSDFVFRAGAYRLTVFAKLVASSTQELMTIQLSISDVFAQAITKSQAGLHFDWGPDLQNYHCSLAGARGEPIHGALTDFFKNMQKG